MASDAADAAQDRQYKAIQARSIAFEIYLEKGKEYVGAFLETERELRGSSEDLHLAILAIRKLTREGCVNSLAISAQQKAELEAQIALLNSLVPVPDSLAPDRRNHLN
ncbi:MAG: hypothetical protein ABIY70_08760 [Capsulimonas sp.]|uniref:hypothetical protein n=1 Tax=Capsulimonas sp. TaxID=2494211 RepID=UPI003263F9F4